MVKYRYQTAPPNEHLAGDWEAHDPVKIFNVYGYCMCCCSSALLEALNREDGRQTRGRILNGHSVPEVWYQNGWHMFDGSLITYFPRPSDGVAAAVDEITAALADWYALNPGYQNNGGKLVELMRRMAGGAGSRRVHPCWRTARSIARVIFPPGPTAGTPPWSSMTARARSMNTATTPASAHSSRYVQESRWCARQATGACTSTWRPIRAGRVSRRDLLKTTWCT